MSRKLSIPMLALAAALGGCATTGQSPEPTAGQAVGQAGVDQPPPAPTVIASSPALPPGPPAQMGPDAPSNVDDEDKDTDTDGDDEADAEEPASPDEMVSGFCADDIYAKYLVARYKAENPHAKIPAYAYGESSPKRGRHGKHGRRHAHRRRNQERYYKQLAEIAGLSYANRVMNGPTAPYFGAIPIVVNDKVDYWVNYFKGGGRQVFMKWLVRSETLKRMVTPLLQEGGVPEEFFYLAMIESGLSNSAYSRTAATGTWQFMRGTAKLYGLKVNHYVDERRDPTKSTVAAAKFLRDLYGDLGDWFLAMAAYNAGPGKIHKAIRQAGSSDFWHLADTPYLAQETKQYVPKVLAAILLANQAKAHGFDVQPDATDEFPDTTVIIKRPVRLDDLAAKLGLPPATLAKWNPELIHRVTPPTKGGYPLRLAAYYADKFPTIEQKLAQADVKDVQMHTVRKGETLARIARRYNVRVKQILAVNPDLPKGKLKPGRTIAIPITDSLATSKL